MVDEVCEPLMQNAGETLTCLFGSGKELYLGLYKDLKEIVSHEKNNVLI